MTVSLWLEEVRDNFDGDNPHIAVAEAIAVGDWSGDLFLMTGLVQLGLLTCTYVGGDNSDAVGTFQFRIPERFLT
ncbi:hypothetical protein A5715_21145 [Mycolicibacter heraklionensis]|nr:hypothetical protein A5715_21145 [Mycolicibacter heraklionensis]